MAASITYYNVLKECYFSVPSDGLQRAGLTVGAGVGFLLKMDQDNALHIYDASGNARFIVFNTPKSQLTNLVTAGYISVSPTAPALISVTPAAVTVTQGSAISTTSLTSVMGGLAAVLTTVASPRVLVTVSGQMANSIAGDGATVDVRYGTGAAPAALAALSGTLAGIAQSATSVSAAQASGFSVSAVVTGLTAGTPYWFDLSLKAITGGTASVTGVTVSVVEF